MDTGEIDTRLQRYTAAEHRIGANLQELEQHSVYQLLANDVLVGKTKQALAGVNSADPTLWEMYSLLGSTLDAARRLRGTNSRISNEDQRLLGQQLGAASVLISSRDIPLTERGLTGDVIRQEHLSIEALIDRMSAVYEPVRDVVTHAEAVLRGVLPRLNSAETTVTRLRAEASTLGVSMPEIDRIHETIDRVRDLSLTDPLSIPAGTRESFDDAIRAASAALASARSSHDALAADIAGASELLDACRELIARANQSRTDAQTKIAQPFGLRQPPSVEAVDGDRGLTSKLAPILASSEPWQVVRRRLDEWSKSASRFHQQLTRVADANAQPLAKRDELRGRLTAFRAKMAATGFSEDFVLRDLSAEAHNELFTSPTDLVRAARLVSEFGNRLATA